MIRVIYCNFLVADSDLGNNGRYCRSVSAVSVLLLGLIVQRFYVKVSP